VVKTFRERLGDAIEFVAADDVDAEMILIVTGCATACAKVDTGIDRPVRYISSPNDAERWIEEMQGKRPVEKT
jgi:hypothetical protein